jgi:hypothetical protein
MLVAMVTRSPEFVQPWHIRVEKLFKGHIVDKLGYSRFLPNCYGYPTCPTLEAGHRLIIVTNSRWIFLPHRHRCVCVSYFRVVSGWVNANTSIRLSYEIFSNIARWNKLELQNIDIVTCYLVTRQLFVDSGFYISTYWVNRQAEFTINYYTLNLTVITLR